MPETSNKTNTFSLCRQFLADIWPTEKKPPTADGLNKTYQKYITMNGNPRKAGGDSSSAHRTNGA